MRKIFFILFCITAITFQTASAALPPLWESTHEIKAILNHEDFQEHLSQEEPVQAIFALENSAGYLIVTETTGVIVEVIHLPNDRMGPPILELRFHSMNN